MSEFEEQNPVEPEEPTMELAGEEKGKKKKKSVGREILEWIVTIAAALAIALVIRSFIFEPVKVDGHSMDYTLADGEIMFVSKYDFSTLWLNDQVNMPILGNPNRFDVVICHYPDRGNTNFVKRIVGLPGDEVKVLDGFLYVNGEKYPEEYITNRPNYTFPSYRNVNNQLFMQYPVTVDEEATFHEIQAAFEAYMKDEAGEKVSGFTKTVDTDGKLQSFTFGGKTYDAVFDENGVIASLKVADKEYIVLTDGTALNLICDRILYMSSGKAVYALTPCEEGYDMNDPQTFPGYVVPEGYYFALGDNRSNSNDSHLVGALKRNMIVGHVQQVIFPFNHWRGIK